MNLRLKRLELFGFKSFADKTVLDFDGSFTGIVGPNGCGKSNVVDAVRWVLGEQRAKSMRGGEMADVIFKGSVSRPPMNVAEVTMVLDNTAEVVAGAGAEISLTRRVFQSGEGEYLLNGDRVRLKDLRNMLFDTGLGSRGYAVLEQGRIDAVLSANPLDRRAIFEEAAGISRYRQRKKEAESRLARVEQDMARVDDVVRELASRVRSLKLQASKAEKYVSVRDEWKRHRTRSLRHRIADLNARLAGVQAQMRALDERTAQMRSGRVELDLEAQRREEEQRALAGQVAAQGELVAQLAGEARAQDERQEQLSARIEGWRATVAEEGERVATLGAELEQREAELGELERELGLRAGTCAAVEAEARALAQALAEVRATYRAEIERSESANQAVLAALHEKTRAQNRLQHLTHARGPLAARAERAAQRLGETRAAAAELAAAAEQAGLESAACARAAEAAERERGERRAELEALVAERRELAARRKELELERARGQSRLAALRDWERERSSLESGARALLESIDAERGPCPAEALLGLFADRVRTSTRYARALDAALGARALALVAREPAAVAPILAWLAERAAGEVELLLPGGLAALEAPRAAELDLGADAALVAGRLFELSECDAGFAALAERLMGDVFVCADLATALELVGRHPGLRFATPEGDIVAATGAQGGYREIAQGAIGRRSSAVELAAEVLALEGQLDLLAARDAELESARASAAERAAAAERGLEDARRAASEGAGAERTARARQADLEAALGVLVGEQAVLASEGGELERDIDESSAALAAAEAAFGRENQVLAECERARQAAERARDERAHAEGRAQIELTRAKAELAGLEQRRRDLERARGVTAAELERARRLALEARERAEGAERDLALLARESQRLADERAAREVDLAELRGAEQAGRAAVDELRRALEELTRELEDTVASVSQRQLEEQRFSLSRDELLGRSNEELELGEAELLEGFEPEPELASEGALAALDQQVAELRRELDRLGPVNTDALADLEETQTRLDFLSGQRGDLAEARASLAETIATINAESSRRFLETFEAVRETFGKLFRQLFGGGRADLTLEEGVDPLEAGIEITARPPGREMLPIGLLSGGQRTMTALGLLFAVFQTRPSPFCVLDEVDAALDDANVGRFLAMLDGFRRDTQFIVVTHNKGTMSACDMLYGITMETKGVSRHVSVEFGDVDDFVPEVTGNAAAASESRDETRAQSARAAADEASEAGASADGGERPDAAELAELAPGEAGVAHELADAERDVVLTPARARRGAARAAEEAALSGGHADG